MKKTTLLSVIVLFLISMGSLVAGEYRPVTPREARNILSRYCHNQLEHRKPRYPYRATFEQAENGNFRALKAIYSDPKFGSGDSEDDSVLPGMMCIAVGDKRMTAFLKSLSLRARRDILDANIHCFIPPSAWVLPFDGKPPHWPTPSETSEAQGWLRRHFPRMLELDEATPHFDD